VDITNFANAPQSEEVANQIEEPESFPALSPEDEVNEPAVETATTAEPEVKTDPRESDPNYWKHRFDVIQGKYNKEVAELRDQVVSLNERLSYTPSKEEPMSAPASVEDAIDELATEYGEEFTTAIDKRVERIVKSHLKNIEAEFGEVKRTSARSVQEKFEDSLTSKVGNWKELNTNSDFIGWLGNVEPYTGISLHTILMSAYNNKDIDKVAKIFNDYNQLTTPQASERTRYESPTPNDLIEPTKRGSISQNTAESNQGKVFTVGQVDQFYVDLRNGKFKGKDAWAESMRREIQLAGSEGRIVG
jgi:hypothetical protein